MEEQSRREFIKLAGTALLVTSGISVFGLVSANPETGFGTGNPADYFTNGYYSDGYYYDGYYADGYYLDGYLADFGEIPNDLPKFLVFPNPSDGNFELVVDAKTPEQCLIVISDLLGQTLVQRNYLLQQGVNSIVFESAKLARGVYELVVITEKGRGSLHLMIAK